MLCRTYRALIHQHISNRRKAEEAVMAAGSVVVEVEVELPPDTRKKR